MKSVSKVKFIVALAVLCVCCMHPVKAEAAENGEFKTESPDSSLEFVVSLSDAGTLTYQVKKGDTVVIENSQLGIVTDIEDFSEGLSFISQEEIATNQEYSLVNGKKSVSKDAGIKKELVFEKNSKQMVLEICVYNDGVAYRYKLPGEGAVAITGETSEFNLPDGTGAWGFQWRSDYEGKYEYYGADSLNQNDYAMPMLASVEDNRYWVWMSEANVYNSGGSYCASHLQGSEGECMKVVFAPEQTSPVQADMPFETPYRVAVITEDLNELTGTDLVTNLNPECELANTEWIQPGKAAWSWWSEERSPQWYLRQKDYIDFAAQNGWEYVTLDAGWDESWVQDLCNYAAERNVGIQIWTDVGAIDTEEEVESKLTTWAAWGIKGIKVDFMMNDSQERMKTYKLISDKAAELQILVNFHGSTKPSGENRTWPQVITTEGVRGSEHYKWTDYTTAYQNCTLPFTRNVAGSMDFTPVVISNTNHNTTQAHQLALSVIFESGIQHFADSIDVYENFKGLPFLNQVPVTWDDSITLDGFPGSFVVTARRSGEDWYIGAITNEARVQEISCDFLGEGTYNAYIYKDGSKPEYIDIEEMQVDKNTILQIPMSATGGGSVYITKNQFDTAVKLDSAYEYYEASGNKLAGNASEQSCGNCQDLKKIGNLGGEKKSSLSFNNIEVDEAGTYELKVFYLTEEERNLNIWINGKDSYDMTCVPSGSYETVRTGKITVELQAGKNEIIMGNQETYAPDIDKIGLKKAEMLETKSLEAEDAKNILSDGIKITDSAVCSGGKKAGYLGTGETITFPEVQADEKGQYLLRIYYLTGDNRNVDITVNDTEHYRVNCFDSGGFDKLEYKEVLIHLEAGNNTILLGNDAEHCPDLDRIEIIKKY